MMNATPLPVDYTRSDAERRMKLLEMAGGDLKRAMELEQWVQSGSSITIRQAFKTPAIGAELHAAATEAGMPGAQVLPKISDRGPDFPAFLDRRKTETKA